MLNLTFSLKKKNALKTFNIRSHKKQHVDVMVDGEIQS